MAAIEELKQKAKQGDLQALQQLRDAGFFERQRAERQGYPVSAAQRRLWVLEQLDGDAAAYNMPAAIQIEGPLDVDALRRALQAIVQRHESLRTTFATIDGELRQMVHRDVVLSWQDDDLRSETDAENAARQCARRMAATPFDLNRGPLVRAQLLQLAGQRWVFLINVHHLVCDGWSVGVLVRETMALYTAFCDGAENPLTPLPIQYRDYARWQNGLLESPAAQRHRDYWLEKLSGALPVLDLPLANSRPANKTYCGTTYAKRLDPRLADGLEMLGHRCEATLFMTLTALVKLLLYRYTGARDIVVGTPSAGRDREELEGQIGFYVNTLALRDTVNGTDSFRQLLDRVKQTCLEAFEHQLYPFDSLVNDLQVDRDPSRSPVFDVLVMVEHQDDLELRLPGLHVATFECPYDVAKFDLSFEFMQTPDSVYMGVNYNTDLFSESVIRRMAGHFEQLAAEVLAAGDKPLDQLDMLTPDERQQLLSNNRPSSQGDPDTTITDLFERQAAATPDHPAVTWRGVTLSYAQLNSRANAIATDLIEHRQVQSGDLVAVILDRSDWMIAALLGILKAGGGYVPIDPEYPRNRISFMLADSGCRVVLTQQRHWPLVHDCLSDQSSAPQVVDIGEIDTSGHCANPPSRSTPDSTAYVIYTSGSTGAPKGCVVTHANVARLMVVASDVFRFGPRDVWVAAHSFCFDFSVWEMYGALLYGGRVVIAGHEDVQDVEALLQLVKQHRVTVLNQTPAAFYNLADAESACREHALDDHLRYVIFGGDRLDPSRLRRWIELYEDRISLVNMYGITETTVHVTFGEIGSAEATGAGGRSPIGAPLPDVSVFVCNPAMQLQPVGVAGEMYVGGSGVCRGYLNRELLTAERFVANPFVPGERFYRTGDVGRWCEDGTLEFLGRNDHQVQVRGFRVEPAEIEAVLREHPRLRDAVVVGRDVDAASRLVAYFVAAHRPAPAVDELQRFLGERLPHWMIPASFVEMEQLPLTANRKIDRSQLPSPGTSRPQLEQPYVTPRDDLEKVLARVFAEVLGVERVGVDDNFFTLGGHSLSATQVVSRLRELLQVNVTLRQFFAGASVAGLHRVLKSDEGNWPRVQMIARTIERLNNMSEQDKAELLRQKKRIG